MGFYGSCFSDADLSILMEFMDAGSLDIIYRKLGTIPEDILCSITRDILRVCIFFISTLSCFFSIVLDD